MSFIVSYKGQFRPYELPDLSHYDRVHHMYRSNKTKRVEDHEDDDFEGILNATKEQKDSNKKRNAVSTYQKVDKFHQQNKVASLARDLMHTPVDCLKDTDTFATVLEHSEKFSYRHFPILDKDDRLVGIVSDKDIIRMMEKPRTTLVRDFMTPEVLTALDSTRIQEIAKIMLHEKINCIPIINDKHILVGIITQSNILNFVIQSTSLDFIR